MARTAATLGEEARIIDYISLGMITSAFSRSAIGSAVGRFVVLSIEEIGYGQQ